MKTRLSILFVLFFCFKIISQETYVPDDNFEQELINLGYDSGDLDDYVPTDNINTITNLMISSKSISDLTGIEDFTALKSLLCQMNQLTNLDLSQNLNLTDLSCSYNELTSLDLSQNVALISLHSYNNKLTNLDLSQNLNLAALTCQNNLLESLNIRNGNNFYFLQLNASNNTNLTCINVDDETFATTYFTNIDSQSYFSENCSVLGINEYNNLKHIFPNPASDVIYFSTNNEGSYKIFNINGQILTNGGLHYGANEINISSLQKGIYFLVTNSSKGVQTKKIIVK